MRCYWFVTAVTGKRLHVTGFLLDCVKVEPFPEHLCSISCRFVTIFLDLLLVYPILLLLVTAFLGKPVTYFLYILGMYVRLFVWGFLPQIIYRMMNIL